MSLSACPECWDKPCTCGYEYKHQDPETLRSQIVILIGILATKESKSVTAVASEILEKIKGEQP